MRRAERQRGVILPIVLVVMMVVTTLVITQVRRGTVDERLAGNWSRVVSGETAAESLLRMCEHLTINVDWKYAKWWYPSTTFTATPAWKVPFAQLDPTKVKVFTDTLPQGATSGYCVIENATSELGTVRDFTGENEQNQQAGRRKKRQFDETPVHDRGYVCRWNSVRRGEVPVAERNTLDTEAVDRRSGCRPRGAGPRHIGVGP